MLATLIIVFREVLEAGLVVGIVLAASRGVPRRGLWVSGGCTAGVLGAIIVAGFASQIANAVEGIGQELFNATILFAAVCMLGWHNIWMSRHGRELAAEFTRIGNEVGRARGHSTRWRWSAASRCCAKARKSSCFSTASRSQAAAAGSA